MTKSADRPDRNGSGNGQDDHGVFGVSSGWISAFAVMALNLISIGVVYGKLDSSITTLKKDQTDQAAFLLRIERKIDKVSEHVGDLRVQFAAMESRLKAVELSTTMKGK